MVPHRAQSRMYGAAFRARLSCSRCTMRFQTDFWAKLFVPFAIWLFIAATSSFSVWYFNFLVSWVPRTPERDFWDIMLACMLLPFVDVVLTLGFVGALTWWYRHYNKQPTDRSKFLVKRVEQAGKPAGCAGDLSHPAGPDSTACEGATCTTPLVIASAVLSPETLAKVHASACPICFSSMGGNSAGSLLKTECGHYFHERCLWTWFDRSTTCPSCRQDVCRSESDAQETHHESA